MNTSLGHVNQTCQGPHSTKRKISDDNNTPDADKNMKANLVFFAIIDPEDPTGNIFTDLYERFPILLAQGHTRHIFVLYDYDSNAILTRAMKNRSDSEMVRVFTDLAVQRRFKPKYQVLDNEVSKQGPHERYYQPERHVPTGSARKSSNQQCRKSNPNI
jgi:hypothetical protein